MEEIEFGETIRVNASWVDFDGDPVDSDSHSVSFYTPSGIISGAPHTTPNQTDPGEYFQKFTIPAAGPAGIWKVIWAVEIGIDVGVAVLAFNVVEEP